MSSLQEIYADLQGKLQKLMRELSEVEDRMDFNKRNHRATEITLEELNNLDRAAPVYKPVGKMFLKTDIQDMEEALKQLGKASGDSVQALKKKKEYLERQKNDVEEKLRDLLRLASQMQKE